MYRLFELFVYQFSGNPIFSNLFIFETDQSSYSSPIETQQFLFSGRLEISSLQSISNWSQLLPNFTGWANKDRVLEIIT